MNPRIKDKLREIERYLAELSEIVPRSIEEYLEIKTKAACERYFEVIVEAVIDIAFLIIKDRHLKIPEDDKQAFDILASEKIISAELSQKLKEAKGMRNLIAHEYGKIDDELVFESITQELERDSRQFVQAIKKLK